VKKSQTCTDDALRFDWQEQKQRMTKKKLMSVSDKWTNVVLNRAANYKNLLKLVAGHKLQLHFIYNCMKHRW